MHLSEVAIALLLITLGALGLYEFYFSLNDESGICQH